VGKLDVYVYSVLALILDFAGISKYCLTVGRTASFAVDWHKEQLKWWLVARWSYSG
jgi:hypothetical protein